MANEKSKNSFRLNQNYVPLPNRQRPTRWFG